MIFEGKTCRKCGSKRRYSVKGRAAGVCSICKAGANAKWNKAHPDSIRPNDRAWKAKNPEKIAIYRAARYHTNPQKSQDHVRAWRQKNPERARYFSRGWYSRNREAGIAGASEWQKRCPERKNAIVARRLARKRGVFQDGLVNAEFLKTLYKAENCFYCRQAFVSNDVVHAEHRIPLRAYGPHAVWNLVPAHVACNSSKIDWLDRDVILDVIATPGGRQWADGVGAEWLTNVLPKLEDGPRLGRELFPEQSSGQILLAKGVG